MESKTKELVKAGHELVVLLGTQQGMHDAASLVQRLTVRLDTTAAAWQEMKKRHDESVKAERVWETTMMQACGEDGPKSVADKFGKLTAERDALAAENAALKSINDDRRVFIMNGVQLGYIKVPTVETDPALETIRIAVSPQEPTPATDAFLREQMAKAHKEGAYFVANRMLAAWEAGFIEDTAKNAADIARMILTSTEFMADAPEGDFDRSFADSVLEDIIAQLQTEVTPQKPALSQAITDIIAERQRQISEKGFSEARDDKYLPGVLNLAGAAYAVHASYLPDAKRRAERLWPWTEAGKYLNASSKDTRSALIKAAALITAEIERIDRAQLRAGEAV